MTGVLTREKIWRHKETSGHVPFCDNREKVVWRHSKRDTHKPRTEASVKTKTCQHLNLRFSGSRIVRENFWLLKPVVFHQSGPRRLTGLQANGVHPLPKGDGDRLQEATVSSLGAEESASGGSKEGAVRKWPRQTSVEMLLGLRAYFSWFPQPGPMLPHENSLSTPGNPNKALLLVKLIYSPS